RISINPQTAKDEPLKLIGRKHTNDLFLKSFKLARDMGFEHINCDIIAGLPEETEEDFKKTLKMLEKLSPESVTIHTMCIKHGSYLDMKYDMYSMTAANTVNNMLDTAQRYMKKLGFKPYYMYRQKNMLGNLENVGYCKNNHECIYNIYIMEEVESIIALGAGGSTKLVSGNRIERVFNVKEVAEYIKRIDEMIERKENLMKEFC
ncbi:MAG: radical SAM protein, partial [Clostridia bacterium]|nr:radical SAM protein [Clostridia bacterium]